MHNFVISSVAAGLFGGAIMLSGVAPVSALTLPSPAVAAAGETGMVEQVQNRKRERAREAKLERRYDRRRHGQRYSYRRPGFHYHYGGYYYSSPWWNSPSIGFAITVPSVGYGLGVGSAHVEWCLNQYRSYDLASDTFMGFDGFRHRCNSPFN